MIENKIDKFVLFLVGILFSFLSFCFGGAVGQNLEHIKAQKNPSGYIATIISENLVTEEVTRLNQRIKELEKSH